MLNRLDQLISLLQNSNANKIILRDCEQSYTGQSLLNKASQIATHFAHQGAKINDRIAIQLPNRMEFALCYFAALIGGYTIVPLNLSLPQKDLDYILDLTKPTVVIKTLDAVKSNLTMWDGKIFSTADTITSVFFTSGTTSQPKGVCHKIENMLENVASFNELAGIDNTICMYHVMPMGYMAGFLNTLLSPILAGGSVVIGSQFDAKNAMYFWELPMKYGVNAMWITPTMAALLSRLNRSVDIPEWTKKHLKQVFVGTAPLPQAIKESFEKTFHVECLESYGMTEVLLVAANTKKYDRKKNSVGRLLNKIKMEVREGDLYISTPFFLNGYLDALEAGEMVSPVKDGWFATGDYGHIDDENNLFITGRIKDIIIHGGSNVSPRAVEEVLLQHPDVHDVAVIGKPHEFWGEEIVVFLTLIENKEFDLAVMTSYCEQNLYPDAIPAKFKILTEFPRASTGKIQKHELKKLL